jgi:hypothetical protein
MIQTFMKTFGFLGAVSVFFMGGACLLSFVFWAVDPGNSSQQYRKAHTHVEDSPTWYLQQ